MLGRVHSIETFGSIDGPGIRFIVFLQGCPLRCQYCHNPDTWDMNKGELKSAEEIIAFAKRYRPYWGTDGGITVSGGEPLVQIDFLIELFKEAKTYDIHTCIDTAGSVFSREEPFFSKFEELCEYTDLMLVDIKHIDSNKHKDLTGMNNEHILDMLKYLSDKNKHVWIRHVLVPGMTDDKDDLYQLREFIDTLKNVDRVEVLPYHTLGIYKWNELGIPYALEGVNPPDKECVNKAEQILCLKEGEENGSLEKF